MFNVLNVTGMCVYVCVPVPSPVSDLTATLVDTSSITVSWLSPPGSVTHYSVNVTESVSAQCQQMISIVCPVMCLIDTLHCIALHHGFLVWPKEKPQGPQQEENKTKTV